MAWTRRELVKAGLVGAAGVATGGRVRGETAPVGELAGLSASPAYSESWQAAAPEMASPLRRRISIDSGWRFALGNANDPEKDFGFGKLRREGTFAKAGRVDGPAAVKFDDAAWHSVDLPHDWAVELPFVNTPILPEHGGKPLGREFPETSVGWYRHTFDVPVEDAGRRISVEFDGIFRQATVFFNGHYIAENMSGYAPLNLDLTDFANYGGANTLVVRVDATLDEGWFYEGAGIYRHVWLTTTAPVHVARWGTFVQPKVNGGNATVSISTEVLNESEAAVQGRVRTTLLDAAGKTVATTMSQVMPVAAAGSAIFEAEASVNAPALWSVENPHLYRAVSVLEADGKPVDQHEATFGIRTVTFDADKGFLLNGKPVKIKGTCNHQDHAGVGAALPDALQAYRVGLLKGMGSNALRTSHNMPTSELLDACDRLGMMVMDETRTMSSNPEGLSELERLIKRDRNHPCVILWSLGNEEPEQGTPRGTRMVGTMKKLQRRLDPSRVSTVAMNGQWGKGISAVVDVQGFNYGDDNIDAFRKQYPRQPTIGTETASSLSTRGIYANDKAKGYVAAYDTEKPRWGNTAEEWWRFYADREWLSGGFVWTGFDYRGEPTPYSWPCISSHFGLMDTCGFPKDNYFYYKVWWGAEPALHVFPHWNWAGREGEEIEVWAYSNQESVELFVNGKSAGALPVERNGHLVWKVKYAPGAIEARASKGGKVVLSERRETAGAPAKVVATANRTSMKADGADVIVVNVRIVDAQGRVVPGAANKLRFTVTGGKVLGVGNGDPSCHEPDKAAERSAFDGLAQAIVLGPKAAGEVRVAVDADGLQGAVVVTRAEG